MAEYLRNRPFMVVKYKSNPSKDTNTSIKGWQQTGHMDMQEMVTWHDRVKDNMLAEAHVIIDVVKGKVIKNRFAEENSDVFKYFNTKYQDQFLKALDQHFKMHNND